MGKKFGKILAASSILAGAGMGAYMYLKKAGLIDDNAIFPGKKLADKVSADAADKLGLERSYVDLSEIDETDIKPKSSIRTTTIANFTISPKAKATEAPSDDDKTSEDFLDPAVAEEKSKDASSNADEKPEVHASSPQSEEDDSLTGDGVVDAPTPAKEPEPAKSEVSKQDLSDQDIKDETIDAEDAAAAEDSATEDVSAKLPEADPKTAEAEVADTTDTSEPAPAEGIEDDDADLFTDAEDESDEADTGSEDDFEPGLDAPSIDTSDSRTIGSVASEEFFNDEQ